MTSDPRQADWLDEIRELNRLFLTYAQALAREGRACLGLPERVARRLRDADPASLDRLAAMPTALFRLHLDDALRDCDRVASMRPIEQMRLALALTVLSSAWHLARNRAFETRMFLHLSAATVKRLRALPLSRLPALAAAPGLLSCAFTDGLTWPALVRPAERDVERMLILITLQPDLAPAEGTARAARRSDAGSLR